MQKVKIFLAKHYTNRSMAQVAICWNDVTGHTETTTYRRCAQLRISFKAETKQSITKRNRNYPSSSNHQQGRIIRMENTRMELIPIGSQLMNAVTWRQWPNLYTILTDRCQIFSSCIPANVIYNVRMRLIRRALSWLVQKVKNLHVKM